MKIYIELVLWLMERINIGSKLVWIRCTVREFIR